MKISLNIPEGDGEQIKGSTAARVEIALWVISKLLKMIVVGLEVIQDVDFLELNIFMLPHSDRVYLQIKFSAKRYGRTNSILAGFIIGENEEVAQISCNNTDWSDPISPTECGRQFLSYVRDHVFDEPPPEHPDL